MQPEMLMIERTDIVDRIDVFKAALDCFGDRNGLGVGQRAEVAAGAADDIGQEADVGGGQMPWAFSCSHSSGS
jgi:hypothetical protein